MTGQLKEFRKNAELNSISGHDKEMEVEGQASCKEGNIDYVKEINSRKE